MSKMNSEVTNKLIFGRVQAMLSININGYNIAKLIESNLNYIIYKKVPSSIIYLSALKKLFLIHGFQHIPPISTGTLFTFPEWTERKDYKEIQEYASSEISDKHIFKLSALKLKPAFRLKHLLNSIRIVRKTELNLRAKIYIVAALYNFLLMTEDAEKHIDIRIRKYVSFSCVMGLENLLTQYFQKRGIPTYNLQHGITYRYEKNLADEIEYHNLITDHHLAWGDYSRNELIRSGIAPGKVHVAGYPRKTILSDLKAPAGRNVIVFLSRKSFHPANLKLIELLALFNRIRTDKFNFTLKHHPSLNITELKNMIRSRYPDAGFHFLEENLSLQETLHKEDIDFCIAVNSTAYYECYIHGIPALRFKDDTFDISHPLARDSFETGKAFSLLIDALYKHFHENFPSENIRKELEYVLGLNKNEYSKLLS